MDHIGAKCSSVFWVIVFLPLVLFSCNTLPPKPQNDGFVKVDDIVKAIQDSIDSVQSGASKLPPIQSVKVALQTVNDTRLSGEADYLVIAIKGYYDNAFTQEIDLTLVPTQVNQLQKQAVPGTADLKRDLVKAIQDAQKEISKSYSGKNYTLNTQEVDVQISFSVVWDGSAGVDSWKIAPLSITASGEVSLKTTNTITVAFSKPQS